MGRMRAEEMAAAVRDNMITRRIALEYHLTVNHYPPMRVELVPVCEAAIDACNAGACDRELPMPSGILFRGKSVARAGDLVESAHLDAFLEPVPDEPIRSSIWPRGSCTPCDPTCPECDVPGHEAHEH